MRRHDFVVTMLDYYAGDQATPTLSSIVNKLSDSQALTSQIAVCKLDTIQQRDSNLRAYYFQLSTLYQILGDSQRIANQAIVYELNTT